TINWGDGSVEDGTLSAAGSSGSISGTHLYDDDGFFSVTICVTDKDTASGCDTLDVIVKNISPTTTLDTTDSVALTADGPSFFISQANASQTRSATGTDIGSDDLTFTWTWGDGVVLQNTHYNNGSTADGRPPANRGAVAPFSATDTVSHTYAAAGSYILSVQLSDDDGDSGQPPTSATIPTLITDKQDCVMTIGFWQHQFNPETRKPQVDHLSLQSYLSLINTASDVFSEVLAASTRTDAWLLLQPEDTSETTIQGQAMEQVLATWLNFAWGAVGWDDSIPDLGRPWHQVMADIEATFLNPHASHTDYVRANDLAVSINEMDAKRKACKKG
ncbi:MAG: PKD domain-containing protein, partial [bacterium]|nr:PKD domain-containing protein [bacterium]